jgi:hypothetical protein
MKERPDRITVYKVKLYDMQNDAAIISRRLATARGAEIMRGDIIPESATEIPSADLEAGEEWTPRGYNPNKTVGFQTQVRAG